MTHALCVNVAGMSGDGMVTVRSTPLSEEWKAISIAGLAVAYA